MNMVHDTHLEDIETVYLPFDFLNSIYETIWRICTAIAKSSWFEDKSSITLSALKTDYQNKNSGMVMIFLTDIHPNAQFQTEPKRASNLLLKRSFNLCSKE